MFYGFDELWTPSRAESRSISAENPRGKRGGGAKTEPDANSPARHLGVGWKARPCITVAPGETVTIAEIERPGIIRHIWMTLDPKFYRFCVLRMYWDNEENPSTEAPIGDFFCCGHGISCILNSAMIAVNQNGGLNSYWPMPFRKSARITIENQSDIPVPALFYQIDYTIKDKLPQDLCYFHAQWRRVNPVKFKNEYVILDGVKGKGKYVGTYLAWTQLHPYWWGEGEIKFFIDGDVGYPTICGTGTEDYVCGAWCFGTTFSHLYSGYPLWVPYGAGTKDDIDPEKGVKHGMYRWHIPDPIFFSKDLRVTIQPLGWHRNEDGAFTDFRFLEDDISSVAYWYQTESHTLFPPLLSVEKRKSR